MKVILYIATVGIYSLCEPSCALKLTEGEPTEQNCAPNINIIDNARQMIDPRSPLPPINIEVGGQYDVARPQPMPPGSPGMTMA